MGGLGSGERWRKKTTVEQCWVLDVNRLVQDGVIARGVWSHGSLTWKNNLEEKVSSVGFESNTRNSERPWLRLQYKFTDSGKEIDYKIELQTTRPHFGGLRWWFTCPLVVGGRVCNRRVGKLYLPPRGVYYGCRNCYDLTYRSCQKSDKRVSALRRLPPNMLMEALRRGEVDALLAIKALNRW